MTKKHFKAIAEIIKDSTCQGNDKLVNKESMIHKLSEYFILENNLFNADKFKNAC